MADYDENENSRPKKEKKLDDLISDLDPLKLDKEGLHFINLKEEVNIGDIIKTVDTKELNEHDTAGVLFQEYYKRLGYGEEAHKDRESAHTTAQNLMGEETYNKVLQLVSNQDLDGAYSLIKKGHQQKHAKGIKNQNMNNIVKMDFENKLKIAEEIKSRYKNIFKDEHDLYHIAVNLHGIVDVLAETNTKLDSAKPVNAIDFRKKLFKAYNEGRAEENRYKSEHKEYEHEKAA